jgi:hypothetical protein
VVLFTPFILRGTTAYLILKDVVGSGVAAQVGQVTVHTTRLQTLQNTPVTHQTLFFKIQDGVKDCAQSRNHYFSPGSITCIFFVVFSMKNKICMHLPTNQAVPKQCTGKIK